MVIGISAPVASWTEEATSPSEPPLPNVELKQVQVVFRCRYIVVST